MSGRHYTRADLALAEHFARKAAVAIKNAHLYSELSETIERLEVANRAKDDFLSLMSHELRTRSPSSSVVRHTS